jgi:tripartite-type tricarboxylate transporter receptor subunit TctC
MESRRQFVAALMATGTLVAASAALAFPDKLVHVVVPFPPGGATDVVARILAARLGQAWNQTPIVENRTGAGGNIGADYVAKSAADGHTLLMASPAEVAINQFLYARLPFDPAKDLVPVARVTSAPLVLVIDGKSPVDSVQALVRYIRTRPDAVNYASSGTGGPQHLAAEWFRLMSGAKMTHVPYRGGAPAMVDLLGGQVELFFSGLPPAMSHIQSGRLRALGVTTAERSSLLPQVPTIAEQGFPGFAIENWQGVFVPAATSAAIIEQLAQAIRKAAEDTAFSDKVQAQGAASAFLNPKAFGEFVQGERQKYSKLVEASGTKAD